MSALLGAVQLPPASSGNVNRASRRFVANFSGVADCVTYYIVCTYAGNLEKLVSKIKTCCVSEERLEVREN